MPPRTIRSDESPGVPWVNRRRDGFHCRVADMPADYHDRPAVYALVEEGGCLQVKLGTCAGHPVGRMAKLQTGNPRSLVLVAYSRHLTERGVHLRWRRLRGSGEWFRLDKPLLTEISTWDWVDVVALAGLEHRLRAMNEGKRAAEQRRGQLCNSVSTPIRTRGRGGGAVRET
jgi:hypothetical protein